MTEKLQKILANAGLGSRREIERWIADQRVKINGRIATLGERATLFDSIHVDGKEIKLIRSKNVKTRVLLYHKPDGELCTRHDPEGRPTIFERLPMIRNSRWICVGRLDFNTSGVLLITNDGSLANRLMHPSAQFEREYAVRIRGELTDAHIDRLTQGVQLEDGIAKVASCKTVGGKGSNQWYYVTVTEGRNRLVRRLFETLGYTVSRLIRIRYGNIHLPSHLKRGKFVELTDTEITELAQS